MFATAALGLVAATAVYLVVGDVTESTKGPKRKDGAPPPGGPTGNPEARAEPEESWAARWETQSDDAIERCRKSYEVNTYGGAIVCILTEAFPEAAPWTADASTWPDWMYAARDQIKEDVRTLVMDEVGSYTPTGWQFQVWLMYDRIAPECFRLGASEVSVIVDCMIEKMYPASKTQRSGWQAELRTFLVDRVSRQLETGQRV